MFDQLVLTNAHDTAKQARYFGITTLVYGAVILAVMVWSVFSFDLSGLNEGDLAFSEIVMPVALPENVPPVIVPDRPQPKAAAAPDKSNFDVIKNPVRDLTNSTAPPDKVSDVKSNATAVRDNIAFTIGPIEHRATGDIGSPDRSSAAISGNAQIQIKQAEQIKEIDTVAPPLPPKSTPAPVANKIVTVSKGVINGIAANLPKPAYPPVARAMHASGEVKVQVLIDELGNVVSASAVSGHPLLRAAAQAAAHQARFTPTKLSDQPVKVTGVIIYNFVAQ